MRLHLVRDVFLLHATLGRLSVEYNGGLHYNGGSWVAGENQGRLPFGWSCEDRDRGLHSSMSLLTIEGLKVRKQTCIPAGTYLIDRTPSPSMGHRTTDGKMMILLNVPGFRYIRIHPGNTHLDTEGCLLPGLARDVVDGEVMRSTKAWTWLDERVRECLARKEKVDIVITREGSILHE